MSSKRELEKWKHTKPFTEKQMKNLMARLYRLFKNHADKFVIGKNKVYQGYISYHTGDNKGTDVNYIFINFQDEILRVVVHECLHYFFPHHKEKEIRKLVL
jgi:predicted metal-dependent hydrolase